MNIPDIVNGCFEFGASLFQLINVIATYRDKKIRGIRIVPTLFFTSWGIWNLYYYPHLNQIWSFIGGLGIVVTNIIWVVLMIKYRRN